jgi:hypothetical protein
MTVSRFIFLYLWIAPHALQAVLAVMIIQRKLLREFPVFFAYTVFEIAQFLVLFGADHWDRVSADQYVVLWLVGGTISIALRFAVVYEIFTVVFRSYPALQEFGAVLFRWATVVLMIVAVMLVGYSSGNEIDRFTVPLTIVDRAVSLIQCGLLVLLILLVRLLSFPWTSYAFGIAMGLGFYASLELSMTSLWAPTIVASCSGLSLYFCRNENQARRARRQSRTSSTGTMRCKGCCNNDNRSTADFVRCTGAYPVCLEDRGQRWACPE